jgi:menaquinone-dependent protoporphyrinogen oxidase
MTSSHILIAYSTTDGHTLKICNVIKQTLESLGHRVSLDPITEMGAGDLARFDKIVIGASIRYGHHSPVVFDFIRRNQTVLDSKPSAFFSVNIVARKPNKNTPETNPYLRKFLRRIDWKPKQLAVFAGKLNYPIYSFFDCLMIRFIMLITHGPTDPSTVVEFTDWEKVAAFGRGVAAME